MAAVNLSASITFNQATASLNANIKAAQDESTDITTLKAQQQQTDAQFDEAGRMRTLLLPQVKDAIDTNASISSELTKITLKQAEAQNSVPIPGKPSRHSNPRILHPMPKRAAR